MPFDGSSSSSSSASAGLTDAASTGMTTDTDPSSTSEPLTSGDGSSNTSDSSTTGSDSTTTGVDASPPAILDYKISPPSLLASGPIIVEVFTEGADGVRLTFGEMVFELALDGEGDEGIFIGEVPIYTGFDNGEHAVTMTPWRGDGEEEAEEEGDAEATIYTVARPPPGAELFWEAGDLIGPGIAMAVDLLPSGDLVEFGTRYENDFDEPRCYLRRRDPGGTWGQGDYLQVLPGIRCEATDLAVDKDGGIHVLARRGSKGEMVWWLGSLATWGAAAETRGLGLKDEQANDLAERDGTLVVCGAMPTGFGDLDVMLRTYRPKLPGDPKGLDYVPPGAWPNSFTETAHGCEFRDATSVVVVGDAFGGHDGNFDDPTTRRFSLVYDPQSNSVNEDPFLVHEPGLGKSSQSFARAVAIGDWGDAIITGYSCLKECSKGTYQGMLWTESQWGGLLNENSLGYVPLESYTPSAVAWHPAHYAIVASGGPGDEFLLRAYSPFSDPALWSFPKTSQGALQIALTVAVGRFGQVYAAGVGASYYPAIAYVGG